MKDSSPAAPLVSVILPTHNRSDLLRRAIASVLGQTLADFELLVVDDCSSEDIGAVVRAFDDSRVAHLRRDTQGGPAGARNTGLAQASGRYVAFQDSDDEWLPDKLERQVEFMERAAPAVALVSCGMIRYATTHIFQFPTGEMRRFGSDIGKSIRMNLVAFTQTWLARRDVLQQIGGFDGTLKIWDDWDLLLRVSEQRSVAYMPSCHVVSYTTPGSIGTERTRRIHDLERFVVKYGAHPDAEFRGKLQYLLGRFRAAEGDASGARRALVTSLRTAPFSAKAWALTLLALAGPAGLRAGGRRLKGIRMASSR